MYSVAAFLYHFVTYLDISRGHGFAYGPYPLSTHLGLGVFSKDGKMESLFIVYSSLHRLQFCWVDIFEKRRTGKQAVCRG